MGHDPDSAIAFGEVGKVGVSIASVEDMADLFEESRSSACRRR